MVIFINLTDLRFSNSIYIIRSVSYEKKTVEQIAKETELSILAVNKIVYDLVKKEIFIKIKDNSMKMGRPKLLVALNPILYSIIITRENNLFLTSRITVDGEYSELFTIPTTLFKHEYDAISYIKSKIDTNDKNLIGIIYVDENADKVDGISHISNYHPIDLFVRAISDEEKVICFEYDNYKILINHGKAKIIECDKSQLSNIIDIDNYYIIDNKDDAIIESVRLLTIKDLKKRI